MAQVIGVVSGLIGILQYLGDLLPQPNPEDQFSLRFGVTLDGNGLNNAEGAVKKFNVYNEDQKLIGSGKGGGDISSGGYQDITIDQSGFLGQQPTYIQIEACDHGLCIAYITQK